MFDIHNYDRYIVSFSGGKDSTACFLYLLECGIPLHKIEIWHQEIDGRGKTFFDWEVTSDYCRQFAKAFGVKCYYQFKQGGFKGEMLRYNSITAPVWYLDARGNYQKLESRNYPTDINTRLKYPQLSADLSVRWCSSYLKIAVSTRVLINDDRFRNSRTLFISGERGEESPQRDRYKIFEPHRADKRNNIKLKRHIDHFRPIKEWKEKKVWELIEKYRVRVHPCYYLGWNRCSCKFCIFGNADQFASAAYVSPEIFEEVCQYEEDFKYTLKRNVDLMTFIQSGKVYPSITPELINIATSYRYRLSIIVPEGKRWKLPAGAYGQGQGAY